MDPLDESSTGSLGMSNGAVDFPYLNLDEDLPEEREAPPTPSAEPALGAEAKDREGIEEVERKSGEEVKQEAESEQLDVAEAEDAAQTQDHAAASGVDEETLPLPDGWIRKRTRKWGGKLYYVHADGHTSWTHPSLPKKEFEVCVLRAGGAPRCWDGRWAHDYYFWLPKELDALR